MYITIPVNCVVRAVNRFLNLKDPRPSKSIDNYRQQVYGEEMMNELMVEEQ